MSTRTRLAAVLSVSALALVGLAGCGEDEPTRPTSGSASEANPTESGGPSESATAEPATTTVPVYFVGDTPQGPRLYREFRQVESDNPAQEALALMVAGDALDPDYRSLFPEGGGFGDVQLGDEEITVALADEAWAMPVEGLSDEDAILATQQLAYTLQGVAQARTPIIVTLDGQPSDLFGFGGELSNEPEIDVRALVNITTPEEGATVSGTFTASGASSSFEATTPWEIRDGSGEVVQEGFATAEGWMDKLYPWETEVDVSGLAPGDYTFVALTDDPSGGEGGGPMEDTKGITVQ